jgi:L-2-hydroxyglutarate oxidase LhgO
MPKQLDVVELRDVRGDELQELEPAATGIRALHVPFTGIIDFSAVAEAYVRHSVDRKRDSRRPDRDCDSCRLTDDRDRHRR